MESIHTNLLKERWQTTEGEALENILRALTSGAPAREVYEYCSMQVPLVKPWLDSGLLDLRGAKVKSRSFENTLSEQIELYDCDLSYSEMEGCTFDRIYFAALALWAKFNNCTFVHCRILPTYAHNATFTDCTFKDFNSSADLLFYNGIMDSCRFTDCERFTLRAVNARFNNVIAENSILHFYHRSYPHGGASFENSTLPRCDFKMTIWPHSTFINCDLSGGDFSGCCLIGTRFSHCDLSGVNFEGAKLRDVIFNDCDTSTCNFLNADYESMELTAAFIIQK